MIFMVTKGSYEDYQVVYHLEGPADMSSFVHNAIQEAVKEYNEAHDEYQKQFELVCKANGIKLPISATVHPKKFAEYLALWEEYREKNAWPEDEFARALRKCEEVGIVTVQVEEVYFD